MPKMVRFSRALYYWRILADAGVAAICGFVATDTLYSLFRPASDADGTITGIGLFSAVVAVGVYALLRLHRWWKWPAAG